MILFCPSCGSLLKVETFSGQLRWKCRLCPYQYYVAKPMNQKFYSKLKEVDDVLGGSAAWENVDATDVRCPSCSFKRAYFMQIQTRSGDEPMTTFYKCCNHSCGHKWRE